MFSGLKDNQKTKSLLLDNLINALPGGIGIYTYKNKVLSLEFINDGYYHMIDTTRSKRTGYMGANIIKAIHKEDITILTSALETLTHGENLIDITFRVPTDEKGTYHWIRLVGSVAQRRSNDDLTLYCSFSDVNSLINLQNELRNSRSLMDSALKAVNITAWELDIPSRTMTRIHSAKTMIQVNDVISDFPGSLFNHTFIEIHPISRMVMGDLCTDALAGKYVTADIFLRPIERQEKKFRWERINYTPIVNQDGTVTKSIGTALDITQQKQSEQNYEERLSLRRFLYKDALALVTLNITKNIVMEINGTSPFCQNLPKDISAMKLFQTVSEAIPDCEEREDFSALFNFANLIKAYKENHSHLTICHRLSHRPGWVETSCDLLNNPYTNNLEAIVVAKDVTKEKQYEQVVNTLVSSDYDVIFTIDTASGNLQLMRHSNTTTTSSWPLNKQITMDHLFAYWRNSCRKEDVEEVLHQNSLEQIKEQLRKQTMYTTNHVALLNEQPYYKRMVYSYLGNDKRSILCAVQDYTEAHRVEQQQKLVLEKALKEAKKAGEAKSNFLSDMSHEIRTPMNSIIGMTKLAKDEVLNNPALALRYLNQIDSSSSYLLGIINDILDMSRIENNKFELNYEWVSPFDVIDSCLKMIEPQMRKKGIHFHNSRLNTLPPDIEFYIDPMRTKQLLINLLNNAYKFTPEGGTVYLEVRNKSLEDGHAVDEIMVSDTGCGISKQFQERIFEPFTQERNSQTNVVQGTGLGLALVKRIITAMGGSVTLTSELNKGSIFTLEIPYDYRVRSGAKRELQNDQDDEAVLQGACVLLAEDQALNALIATRLLEKKHIKVVPVSNGQQAVDQFSASPVGSFDAILMDIRMPLLNGWDATKIIRKLPRPDAQTIPILAMTANAFEDDVKTSLQSGMNDHLSKPIEPEKLYKVLASFLAKKKNT